MEETKTKVFFFDSDHAVKYGVNAAILINYFKFFIELNIKLDMEGKRKAGNSSFRDGRTFSYISKSNLAKHFPFFTEAQVKHGLSKLVAADVFITGCYNKQKYDKTLWYAFKNEKEFLDFPAQYREFLQAQGLESPSISDINSKTDDLSSNPCENSLDKSDQRTKIEPAKKPMDDAFLTNPMVTSTQSIGDKSPTIPINATIIQNNEYTYLPCDILYDEPNSESIDDDEVVANNNQTGKVGKESFSAAFGSSHNVDDYCSIADIRKLTLIMDKSIGQSEDDFKRFGKWYDWILTKQKDVHEIKHSSAWIKSYLKFVEKNAVFEQAAAHESNRIKQEKIARQKMNTNPYNDMRK